MLAPLSPLRRDQLREAALLLAEAFDDDPMFRYLIRRDRARRTWLRAFMWAGLRMVWPSGHVYALGADRLEGVILLLPPGRYPPSLGARLAFSVRLLWRAFIGQPRPAIIWRTRRLEPELDAGHPDEPHWMLYQIAVAPSAQGRGLGRRLLEGATLLAEQQPAPMYLDTTKESNLALYARFGFSMTRLIELPGVPPAWTMIRPAPP